MARAQTVTPEVISDAKEEAHVAAVRQELLDQVNNPKRLKTAADRAGFLSAVLPMARHEMDAAVKASKAIGDVDWNVLLESVGGDIAKIMVLGRRDFREELAIAEKDPAFTPVAIVDEKGRYRLNPAAVWATVSSHCRAIAELPYKLDMRGYRTINAILWRAEQLLGNRLAGIGQDAEKHGLELSFEFLTGFDADGNALRASDAKTAWVIVSSAGNAFGDNLLNLVTAKDTIRRAISAVERAWNAK